MKRVAFGRYGSRYYKPRLVDWPVVGQGTEKRGFHGRAPCLPGNRHTGHHDQRPDWTMTGAADVAHQQFRFRNISLQSTSSLRLGFVRPRHTACPIKRIRGCSARDPSDAEFAAGGYATTPEAGPRQGLTGNCRVRLACHYHVKKPLNAMLSGWQPLASLVGRHAGIIAFANQAADDRSKQAGGIQHRLLPVGCRTAGIHKHDRSPPVRAPEPVRASP